MSFTRRPGSGRPRQTSRQEDRHIIRNARVQPSASSAAIQAQVAPSLEALCRHTAPTSDVVVWGAIACNTRSPLVFIRGTIIVQRYVHDILQPHVLPFMQRLPGALFQQDNARPHTARVSQDCLRTVCYYPSLVYPISRFVSNLAYVESFGTVSWASNEFVRTRDMVTANME
ncbi:transposable element Tcb2 transposase [Trichonephila clavipes]|nr:transposable element Tcb2 transposase [Trichonephila clavipes]